MCIGTGVNCFKLNNEWLCAPEFDMAGNIRPLPERSIADMGAYEHALGEPTFVVEKSKHTPTHFILSQNYPNPFNPITHISITLPKSEFVTLKVYNLLGIEVKTLISAKLYTGEHSFTFDGTGLASGIYYYEIVAGGNREVRKMVLLIVPYDLRI